MDNLFIIGNGFDLAHGLKTKYSHFRDFLVQMEKEDCEEAGEISISDDYSLLEDDSIKYHFDNTVIPVMTNTLSETLDFMQQKDVSTGMTPLDQIEEITQFLNDADQIVQWIKHGSDQYYKRAKNESQAIKRFIEALEPQTGIINHNTNLNTTSAYWQTIESEFGEPAAKFLKNGDGSNNVYQYNPDEDQWSNWTSLDMNLICTSVNAVNNGIYVINGRCNNIYTSCNYYAPVSSISDYAELRHLGSSIINPSGNLSRSYTDMSFDAPGFTLNVSRVYNSNDKRASLIDGNWTFGFSSNLKQEFIFIFITQASSNWRTLTCKFSLLALNASSACSLKFLCHGLGSSGVSITLIVYKSVTAREIIVLFLPISSSRKQSISGGKNFPSR